MGEQEEKWSVISELEVLEDCLKFFITALGKLQLLGDYRDIFVLSSG